MDNSTGTYEYPRYINKEREVRKQSQYKDYVNRWTVYDSSVIEELKNQYVDDEMLKEYYNGLPCRMEYILAGKTVEREAVRQIMEDEILGHNLKSHIAILDAGGEGKTTALMQLVVKLVESGKRVYFSQDAPELHIENTVFDDNDIIVIDNANHVKNIYDLLLTAANKGVRVIFAARANEWEMQKINVDIIRNIKGYNLSDFSLREKQDFARLLSGYTQLSEKEIFDIFDNDSNQFLLAAMLRTMNGGINLDKIVEDIIRRTKEGLTGAYKDYALFILTIVCLIEQTGAKMPTPLFRNICTDIGNGIKLDHKALINIYLKKEIQGTSVYVETRHPRISELFYKNLVKFIDIDLVYEEFSKPKRNIIKHKIDRVHEYLDIVGKVSRYIFDNYPEFSDYIDFVIESNLDEFYVLYQKPCKTLFKIWTDIKAKAVSDNEDETVSIDSLYEKAINKWFVGGNGEMWYHWAKFHIDRGNIGTVNEPYTARWIFNRAFTDNQAQESLLIAWADLEASQGNYGDISNPEPYTARWIYRWGIDNRKASEHLVYNWAEMEEALGNYGDFDREYSARWLYHWGITNNAANENMLIKWADMEIERGNTGDVTIPYSALWIYHWGYKNNKADENLLIKWAELEISLRGLGDIKTEYTARWIFNWGLNNDKADENLFTKWAEAEFNEDINNAGEPWIPYTARWIFSYGFKARKANKNLIYKWLRMEFELKNIEPADKEYTVFWLLDYARKMRFDERTYWLWLIGVEMEIGRTDLAYKHCKEAILSSNDIYGIFALVQGERNIREGEDGLDNLMQLALKKDIPIELYCCYLCDLLYKDGKQAERYLLRFHELNGNLSEYSSKGFFKFWIDKANKNGLIGNAT